MIIIETIEMETSCVFKYSQALSINVTELLCISDNNVINKSLYNEITNNMRDHRYQVITLLLYSYLAGEK